MSEATIFNYFSSREALLGEWAHESLDQLCQQACDRHGARSPAPLRRSVREVTRALRGLHDRSPRTFVRIWAIAHATDPSLGRPGGVAVADEVRPGARALIARAREQQEIRLDLPLEQQVRLLNSAWISSVSFESALSEGRAPIAELGWQRVQRDLEALLDGLRKRNERVRGPAALATTVRGGDSRPLTNPPGR